MTRISSLIVATTLAILPLSAFAQQNAAPVKTAAPTSMTSATPAAATTATAPTAIGPVTTGPVTTGPVTAGPAIGKTTTSATAKVIQPTKSDVTTTVPAAKSEVHGMNPITSHHAKVHVPAKAAEPARS